MKHVYLMREGRLWPEFVLPYLMIMAVLLAPLVAHAQSTTAPSPQQREEALQRLSALLPEAGKGTAGLSFTENRGQVIDTRGDLRPDILYTAISGEKRLYLRKTGLSYVFMKIEGTLPPFSPRLARKRGILNNPGPEPMLKLYRMDVELLGANPQPEVIEEAKTPGHRNYYLAHAPQGILDVESFRRVIYRNVYPGIDMVLRGHGEGLKYDFVVHPGADPSMIRLNYRGGKITRRSDGGLRITNEYGALEEGAPYTYQEGPGDQGPSISGVRVGCRYVVRGNEVSFRVDRYDSSRTLVIDPVVEWASYLGGTTSEIAGSDIDISVGPSNELGMIGSTISVDFPATQALNNPPTFQRTLKGARDVFVAKMDGIPNLHWCTFYGGTDDDNAGGIVADKNNNYVFCGWTRSTDFPVFAPLKNANAGDEDLFVAKLDNNGLPVWSTYNGGKKDDEALSIALDAAGNILLCGLTKSTDFPVRQALMATPQGATQGFIMKMAAAGNQVLYSTYFGGAREDWCTAVTGDANNDFYVVGITRSNNLPMAGAMMPYNGKQDGFIVSLSGLNAYRWGTYWGGNDSDAATSVTVNAAGDVIFCGYTASANLPASPGVFQRNLKGGYDMFASGFTPLGAVKWSTFYGGAVNSTGKPDDFGYDVICTPSNDVYLTGYTLCEDFPVTLGTYQGTRSGPSDAFMVRLDAAGAQEWATYYGGSDADQGYTIALNSTENLFVAGSTASADLPEANKGLYPTFKGVDDAFIVKFYPICARFGPAVQTNATPKLCQGQVVTLQARAGGIYLWQPGGETTRSIQATTNGDYTVIITDPEGCFDTGRVSLRFYPKPVPFIQGPRDICAGDSTVFDAGVGPGAGAFVSYKWSTGATSSRIWVKNPGVYTVQVVDTNGCVSDQIRATLEIHPLPEKPPITTGRPLGDTVWLCPGRTATLEAPAGYYNYNWSTGDITRRTVVGLPGIYTLRVSNPLGCVAYSDPVVVANYPQPRPKIRALGPTTFCPGDSVTLVAEDPLVHEDNFRWSNGGRGSRITVTADGVYRVTGRSDVGCSGVSEESITVTIRPRPNVAISGPEAVCADAIATYRAPGGLGVKYSWELFGNGTLLTGTDGPSIRIKWGATGFGTITLRAIDTITGCTGESQRSVRLGTELKPVIIVGGPTTFCVGDSVVLDAGAGYMKYEWSTGDTTQFIMVRDTGEFKVSVVDSGNCAGTSDPVRINVVKRPTPEIKGPRKVCLNAVASYSTQSVPGNLYRWFVNGGTILSGDGTPNVSVQWGSGGTGSVDVVETSGGLCDSAAPRHFVAIGTELEPEIAASGKLSFCLGDSVVLDAGDGYVTYEWSNGATTRSIVVRTSGTYSVKVADAGGCSGGSQPVTVTASPVPTVAITAGGPTTFCSGDSVTLDAGPGFATYAWTNGAATRSIIVKQSGNYGVTVGSSAGCTATAAPVVVNVERRPTPAIGGPIKVCWNSTVDYSTPDVPGNSYVWTVTGGTIVSGDGTSRISVRWGTDPNGVIELVESNPSGLCRTVAKRYEVSIGSELEPVIIPSRSLDLCPGDVVELDAGSGYASYEWSTGATTQTITVSAPGNYSVKVADAGGCSGSSQPVTVVAHPAPTPVITAAGSTTIRAGDSVQLDAGSGYVSYEWSTGATTQTIMVSRAGDYSVTVVDAFGCRGVSPPVKVSVITTPLPLAAEVELPTLLEAAPGERVVVPLRLRSSVNFPAAASLGYRAKLRYRASLLIPTGATPGGSINGSDMVLEITGTMPAGTTSGDLMSLEFIAALADTLGTRLVLEDFRWSDSTVATVVHPGEFRLTGLCVVGTTRLVGAAAGAGLKPVRPNPSGGRAEIEYELAEHGRTQIVITDMAGHQVGLVLDADAAPGRYLTSVDASALPSGLYMVTLRTPTLRTSRILRVVK